MSHHLPRPKPVKWISRRDTIKGIAATTSSLLMPKQLAAQDSAQPLPPSNNQGYTSAEILTAGHSFFGSVSQGLASTVEWAFARQGRPNGYILGEEGGGAFVAGLRYGEGQIYTKNVGTHRVFWQGPSIGFDFGAEGAKTMMLVYNLPSLDALYRRFAGIQGSAYFIAGVGISFLGVDGIIVAPIRSGVGARLGANIGYLKFSQRPTWNPF